VVGAEHGSGGSRRGGRGGQKWFFGKTAGFWNGGNGGGNNPFQGGLEVWGLPTKEKESNTGRPKGLIREGSPLPGKERVTEKKCHLTSFWTKFWERASRTGETDWEGTGIDIGGKE